MNYSFIRDSFDINSIAKSFLSIQISPDGFSLVINPLDNLQNPDYIYIQRINQQTEKLNDELKSFKGFDLREFHSIKIIIHDPVFALVPEAIFELSDMKAYLSLNHPERVIRKAFSNLISSAKAVSIFSIDEDLYKLLKSKFPGADFCHSSLPFCSMALNSGIDGCYIQVYEQSMELLLLKENKLVHYNIYEIEGNNDIIYHVMNAYKTFGLNSLSNALHIAGVLTKESETVKTIAKYIKGINFYTTDYIIIPEKGEFEYPSHYFLNHREILKCEL